MKDIMAAAGHKSVLVALEYMRDAYSILQKIRIFNEPSQNLGKFSACYSAGDENAVRVCDPCRQWQKPLPELVKGFMEERVQVIRGDPRNKDPK